MWWVENLLKDTNVYLGLNSYLCKNANGFCDCAVYILQFSTVHHHNYVENNCNKNKLR